MELFDAVDTGARSAFLIEINKLSKNTFSIKLSSDRTTFRDRNLNDQTFRNKYNMQFDLSPSDETQPYF